MRRVDYGNRRYSALIVLRMCASQGGLPISWNMILSLVVTFPPAWRIRSSAMGISCLLQDETPSAMTCTSRPLSIPGVLRITYWRELSQSSRNLPVEIYVRTVERCLEHADVRLYYLESDQPISHIQPNTRCLPVPQYRRSPRSSRPSARCSLSLQGSAC